MKVFLGILFCLFSLSLPSQEKPENATAPDTSCAQREEKEISFYPGGKLKILSKVPGNIRIVGWKKGSVRVVAEKTVRDPSAENAQRVIEQFPLRVRHDQTSATIEVQGTPAEGGNLECNLTVHVPGDKTDIVATISQGDISVESVNGWIELTTDRGNLQALSMSGYFSGSTQHGDIRVEMSERQWRGLEFGAATLMGSIDLQLPGDYSAKLRLETLDGEVFTDYPPQMVDGEPVPLAVGIRKKAQVLDTSVGTGGAPIKLRTRAGDVRLSLKE